MFLIIMLNRVKINQTEKDQPNFSTLKIRNHKLNLF